MSADSAQPVAADLVPAPRPCPGLRTAAIALLLLGAVLCLAAVFTEAHRVRLGYAYLWAFAFVWTVALGALFFVGLQHLVRAVWSVVVRRVAEMFASSIWLVAFWMGQMATIGCFAAPLIVCCQNGDGSSRSR